MIYVCLFINSPLFVWSLSVSQSVSSLSLLSSSIIFFSSFLFLYQNLFDFCINYLLKLIVHLSERQRENPFHLDLINTMTTSTPTPVGPHSRKKVSYYYDFDVGNYYYG
jgi:hypothetical protein